MPPTPTKPRKNSENRSTGCGTTGASYHWTDSPPIRARRRRSALSGRAKPANAQSQATESVTTMSCRVVTSEASGCSTRHTSPGVPVPKAVTSGDRGALGGDVSRLWYSGRQHATCTFGPPCRRAGKLTPAVGPRDLPLPEAVVCPPPSGKRRAL